MHSTIPISQLDFVSKKEEELVATLVYSSFRRVPTSMLCRIDVFNSRGGQVRQTECKGGLNTEPFRIQYIFTTQLNG